MNTPEEIYQRHACPLRPQVLGARVAAGDWADAALQLNGLNKDDIKCLGHMITHDERSAIMRAAYRAMPAWLDRVVDDLAEVDT